MCIVCIEYLKNKLTYIEAKNALPELISMAQNEVDQEHYLDLKLADKEDFDEIVKRTTKMKS